MNWWLKLAIQRYVIAALFLWIVLLFIGGLPLRQGIVLGLSMALIAVPTELVGNIVRPPTRFTPFYVRLQPNWYQILSDFKILRNVEEWHSVLKSVKRFPSSRYCVVRNCIFFTVLQVAEEFRHPLIFWNGEGAFTTDLTFQRELEPILLSRKDNAVKLVVEKDGSFLVDDILQPSRLETYVNEYALLCSSGNCQIQFFMKSCIEGFDLGIGIPDWWWQQVKDSCPAPEKEHRDHATGYVELVLARIAHCELDCYWEPVPRDIDFHLTIVPKMKERREQLRQKLGWETIPQQDIPEMPLHWPEAIEHKYFRIEHRAV